ncbi:carboxylesterase [Aspergillus heteromorphus CBS 117.55]|uniref:Carboxylic ester hydrolase n=1 Tax=Aspergillus heteromorphus CBS 117.55 TaxID=1448321 RepID=A0A317WPA5_9EURO|nr:carboxylesterase [Aspergillus heteromorphus CBS 117.55]PWY88243.1 carboxylesterase [Aspergillus heteromorphus CBS 117.55]
MRAVSTLAGLAAVPLVASAAIQKSALPVVNTTLGYVQGAYSPFRGGNTAVVYKGIPFAAPPTGENRWKEPQAVQPWTGVLNATEFGPQCAQTISSAGIFSSGKNTTSEDCLYLNIWTPNYNETTDLASKNLPVYFWIYGGRFEGGSGDVITYDGTGLAAKDIIVVTINYRLGPFGFLAHPELSAESGHNSSGMYGILDQQAALRWIHENIANFGGNASQITVGGQSAGSASALDSMWSPLNEGLVAGVIAESGARGPHDPMTGSAATSHRTKAAAEAQGVEFLKELNVSSIAELRTAVSMDTLLDYDSLADTTFDDTQFANLSAFFMDPPMWRPNIDGYVLPYNYGQALSLGAHADVPILTGNNKDESGAETDPGLTVATYKELYSQCFLNFSQDFFALYPGQTTAQANNNSNALYRDMSRVGTWQWALDWAAGGAKSPVYTYYFTHTPAENPSSGAYHGSELWYTFNNIPYSDYSDVTWQPADYKIESRMSDYWVNFIRNGNPNGDGLPEWPASGEEKQTMWLADSWGVGPISDSEERIEFIESWFATMPQW